VAAVVPAVAAATLAGVVLGSASTADPRWTGWIGSSAAPWLVATWLVARRAAGPLAAGLGVTGGIAGMMLTYDGSQEAIDRSATFGYSTAWIVVTVALGVAAAAWRATARDAAGPAVAAGVGAVAVPVVLLAVFQALVRRPEGSAVGVAVAVAGAAGLVLLEREAVVRGPRIALLGSVAGSALFALGGLLVIAP
jgi:hypothetical protein